MHFTCPSRRFFGAEDRKKSESGELAALAKTPDLSGPQICRFGLAAAVEPTLPEQLAGHAIAVDQAQGRMPATVEQAQDGNPRQLVARLVRAAKVVVILPKIALR